MFRDPRPAKKPKSTKFKNRTFIHPGLSEEELYSRFVKTVILLFSILTLSIFAFVFLGPTIGSIFGLISVHRNETGKEDTIPPAPPVFSNAPKATKEKAIKLSGVSEPGATLKLFVNGPVKATATADKEGSFIITDLVLIEGKNLIFAKAEDQQGNESEKSTTLTIVRDSKKPEIKILEPSNGATVRNLNSRITVKGKINEKASVTVNDRKAIVKADNSFEIVLGITEGSVVIKVKAVDEAGNEKTESITVTFQKES